VSRSASHRWIPGVPIGEHATRRETQTDVAL
jgi:hypothetical protein